jgi:hypothetical protein
MHQIRQNIGRSRKYFDVRMGQASAEVSAIVEDDMSRM